MTHPVMFFPPPVDVCCSEQILVFFDTDCQVHPWVGPSVPVAPVGFPSHNNRSCVNQIREESLAFHIYVRVFSKTHTRVTVHEPALEPPHNHPNSAKRTFTSSHCFLQSANEDPDGSTLFLNRGF